ncbi:DUF4296 domain-containing protein [Hymenobacter sp. RP-2-7]|uniref:DUF4296 domain-containing protein n=1 Tax=Hymenobacter polaris TaxID=2682546 RepID=A0A7Y0ACB5_9BACT|nr:DUF4296 domain-containing protein [Hymenobacter polaris]NML64734.1 DUF4296 domain-containing protein [Hymenobacter polaris]
MKLLPPSHLPRALATSLLLLAGCARPEEAPKPANLVPKDQMVSLLVRLHLLEARIEASRLAPDSARALFLAQQRDLLWQRHISEQDSSFERSYRYYAVHNKDLDEIYAGVIDSLEKVEKRFGAPQNSFHH